MSEPLIFNTEPRKGVALTYEDSLSVLKSVAAETLEHQKKQEQLRREWPKNIWLAVKADMNGLFSLVEGKDELDVKGFLAVYEISRVLSDFLQDQRRHFESAAGGYETISPQPSAAGVSERQKVREQFRREWPTNIVIEVTLHIAELVELTEGKDELDGKDFLEVCEASLAFFSFLQDVKEDVETTACGSSKPLRQTDEVPPTTGQVPNGNPEHGDSTGTGPARSEHAGEPGPTGSGRYWFCNSTPMPW